ncbi:NAD(+) diphosphatase [Vibrio plantisponsor]
MNELQATGVCMLKNSDLKSAYWCVVSGSELWTIDGTVPFGTAKDLELPIETAIEVEQYKGHPVYWLNHGDLDKDLEMTSLRELLVVDEALFLAASRAVQYGHMSQTLRFCPQCGGRNHLNHRDLAMQCQDCRTLHYPRIFPCIIVAVRKENQILLAQHPRHQTGMYTVIAGFLEVGETLEQCVAREVLEETGISVKNIRYFGSQPWAFPSSMMMAFLADFAGGDIRPDYSELSDAQWFTPSEMPPVAPKGTIARALIEHTVNAIKDEYSTSI